MTINFVIQFYLAILLITLGYINNMVMSSVNNFSGSDFARRAFVVTVSVFWPIFWPVVILTGVGILFNEENK